MPDAQPAASPYANKRQRLTKRVYKHDFVRFSPPGLNDVLVGRVTRILRESEVPRDRVFLVQHVVDGVLRSDFSKVAGNNVTLHPVGRESVLDD